MADSSHMSADMPRPLVALYTKPGLVAVDTLAPWEQEALRKLRLLRQAKKSAMLYVTENGAILVFRGEPAGIIPP